MRTRFPISLALVLGLQLFLAGPIGAKPTWDKVRLSVTPGVGTADFKLGEPLPTEWPEDLGPPDVDFAAQGTGEGLRRLTWGDLKLGQLEKGLAIVSVGEGEETTIVDIEIKRMRAGVDKENLFLGLPEENISKRSSSVQRDGKTRYLLPGLTIETADGKLVGLQVHSPSSTRWRFQRWRLRPGKAAGPIRLGEPLDESLFQSIGEPHQKSREEVLWRATDSDQSLKVQLEKRSQHVTRIQGIGLPWRTPNGVTIGDTVDKFKAKHGNAKDGLGRAFNETILKLPGLRATFTEGKLTSFDVYPLPK